MWKNRKNEKNENYGEYLFSAQEYDFSDNVNYVEGTQLEELYGAYTRVEDSQNKAFLGSVISKTRFTGATFIIVGTFLIFLGIIVNMQIVHGAEYKEKAENNRIRLQIIPAERGIIVDRNGVVLAQNDPVFQIIANKDEITKDINERNETLQYISDLVGGDVNEMINVIDEAKRDEQVMIIDDIPYDPAIRFTMQLDRFEGFFLEVAPRRSYITDEIPSLSHILGYTGVLNPEEYKENRDNGYRQFDHIGKQGLESEYETYLRGTFGRKITEVDAFGDIEHTLSITDAVSGKRLTLELDSGLQKAIENSIINHLESTEATNVSVVVMDVHDGAIYSMVSWPSYDANLFTHGIDSKTYAKLLADERMPLFPRAYAGEFPAGSTIKPTYAAAALTEGIITPTTSFLSTGGIRVGLWFFPDWKPAGHGVTNVYHAIADSVNTFFYMIGGGKDSFQGLGVEKLMMYAKRFGYGLQSGIDIPGEANGFLPSKEWKLEEKGEVWYVGDTYNLSIGQGDFLATPLQIARASAVFANGGFLVTPHLAIQAETESIPIISEDIAKIVRDAMRETVTNGTAQMLNNLSVTSAGKTGTAQWSSLKKNHAWYTGFAPFEDPEISIAILVEEGADDYLAVPIAKDIYEYWFSSESR